MSAPTTSPRSLLGQEVARPESELNLARAALLIAKEEYPQISVDIYLARLDQMAAEVQDRLANETAPPVVLDELLCTLYQRRGLQGNRKAYYDPRNSYLNDVLDRGLGIPLTLGMVLLEVGWRLDLPLEGVNFPGHFLVRYKGDAFDLLVDPFDAGKVRFEDQSQELLDEVYGGMVKVQPAFLTRADRRDMIVRLLTNLKGVYTNVGDHARALAAVDRVLLIRPGARGESLARGFLLARLGRRDEAANQLEACLDGAPAAADADRIRVMVDDLRAGRTISEEGPWET